MQKAQYGYKMNYDVIVVGGGHAGVEASLASARMGNRTLLLSMLAENVGATSCNPAVGGLAKGHLVRELDALGGQMGLITDEAGIQFRILNQTKGPAVRGSRAQIDMDKYRVIARNVVLNTPNLELVQETVESLIVEEKVIKGVKTDLLNEYKASRVIITSGTFLNGIIHVGEVQKEGGRYGEERSVGLSSSLKNDAGLLMDRLKTGTCARIDSSTIDFSVMEEQGGDELPSPFSFRTDRTTFRETKKQLPCYIAYTNEETHKIISSNFYRAPLFTGQIAGKSPRYCPSIEDKVSKFADKDRHHLFIEPQTMDNTECYINGLSTSLPPDVQRDMIHSVKGMENAKVVRYGYAIEYDFVDPRELKHSLETKKIKGLYLAGQINGTTGYEEAGAQGLLAGINAASKALGLESWVPARSESYIGVMVDDLVNKGVSEPYRMFTSRAEFRLQLREDNADIRLSGHALKLGLLKESWVSCYQQRLTVYAQAQEAIKKTMVGSGKVWVQKLNDLSLPVPKQGMPIASYCHRADVDVSKVLPLLGLGELNARDEVSVRALLHYDGYLGKQQLEVDKFKNLEKIKIPSDINYADVLGLSTEVRQKLSASLPQTLAQASQISGITPAAISCMLIWLKSKSSLKGGCDGGC